MITGVASTRSLNAPPHDTPPLPASSNTAPSTAVPTRSTTAPTSQTLEFNQFETLKERRPRPASYHGRPSHIGQHSRVSSVHRGGVRPLQLPIKVASAATSRTGSPRLSSDLALPPVIGGGDDEESVLDSEFASSPQTAPPIRTRFQLEDPGFVPLTRTGEDTADVDVDASAPTATRHRRISSQQAFAQQERESLLFRIAELERALQDREGDHGGQNGTSEGAASFTDPNTLVYKGDEESNLSPLTEAGDRDPDSGSRYPSPPASPPESTRNSITGPAVSSRTSALAAAPMKSLLDENFAVVSSPEDESADPAPLTLPQRPAPARAHDTRVLDEESSSHPKLLLISPTLPPPPRASAEEEGDGIFVDADEVSSPTRA